ncbi:MAG: magnesium chelatase [Pseudomonadota bacterium]
MMRSGGLALAKAMLQVWSEALYGTREPIVVIGFGGNSAQLLKAPGTAPLGATWIRAIEGGGGTPIVAAVSTTEKTLHRLRRQSPTARIACWLLTDGRFTVLPAPPTGADWCAVVDFDSGRLAVGRSKEVASHWSATYMSASELVEQT